uniref:hypothetical protein n=1 Tax=Tessaracoccus timonensis TaxID=2161816 RepID=UPI000D55309C|nr:hypothetical protein [Tessaracoccus timonensis]
MSGPAQPGTPGFAGAPNAPRPNRTPYFIVIGVLAVALIGLLVWAFMPTDDDPSPEPSAEPTPSATEAPSEPEPSDAPSTDVPASEAPPSDDPSASDPMTEGYAILREMLPEKLESWELHIEEAGGHSQPVYRDGDRQMSFFPVGANTSPEEMSEGRQDLQQFDGGACYLNPNPTGETKMITCAIAPKAAQGHTFLMSSRYAEIDEMVRLAKAIIAVER